MTEPIVQDLFATLAETHGERVAILTGSEQLRYRELEEGANRLANALLDAGALPGAIVALWLGSSSRVVTSILGVLRAGCVFMPLDSAFPERRLRAMLAEARPAWVVVDSSQLADLSRLTALAPRRLRVVAVDVAAAHLPEGAVSALAAPATRPVSEADPEAMCSVYFTSGSTGHPKAIAGRLKGIGHFVRWEIEAFGVGPGTRTSQLVSPAFDGYLRDAFVPLLAGGTLCVPERRDILLDSAALLRFLEDTGIELLHCVPSLFRALLNERLDPTLLPALRTVALFGEPLLPADVDRFQSVFGDRIRLVNLYGPTETTMVKLAYEVQPGDRKRRTLPVGKPIPGCEVLVLDERGRTCPVGVAGEIYLRTPYRSLGYLHRPELTREAFVPNPRSQDPDDIVYRTGDFGRLMSDGNLEFLGRRDGQVKIRGVRIEPAEIESCLREHPDVRDVAVIDRDDGMGGRRLYAYLVLKGELEVPALRAHVGARLPEAMVPERFVAMEALPRTLNGKVDRKALPEPPRVAVGSEGSAPEGTTELLLVQIWGELLGLEAVPREASFFELGGHSLMAMQLLTRVRSVFQVEIPVRELFDLPSLASLGRRIDELRRKGTAIPLPAFELVPAEQPVPASFEQATALRRWQELGWSPTMACPVSFELTGALDVGTLARSFTTLVADHSVLRTRLEAQELEAWQRVEPLARVDLAVIDLAALSAGDAANLEPELLTLAAARDRGGPTGPALVAWLLRLAPTQHRLQLLLHETAVDETSLQILHRELAANYRAGGGRPVPRPGYRDWVAWQRLRAAEGGFEAALDVWRRRLVGAGPAFSLLGRALAGEAPSRLELVELEAEVVQGLRLLARQTRTTPFLVLLAAFVLVLGRQRGQPEVIVGVPFAGRGQPATEGIFGPLARVLPIRAAVDPDRLGRDLLDELREALLEAQAHQDVPLDRLHAECWLPASPWAERFPVRFVYQNLTGVTATDGAVDGLALSPGRLGSTAQRSELVLRVVDLGRIVRLRFESRLDGLAAESVRALAEEVVAVLGSFGAGLEQRLAEVGRSAVLVGRPE